ncbi:MAG: fatty acid desaturase [Bacteroidetes bacterium]|nr:fatty acid desaturase [Bacteroidota bacterium]MBT3749409.1 fatty acid desaturase [Bacteroidota bacterium]MBT4398766.1 fatty acid desaturase [Bacteroidota bacterium]MBT4409336.1 fatty acid desaturase [Bacteroidota bacterium]MBT5425346.1 fatty acid desaturase [Bacteroidota bacterium]
MKQANSDWQKIISQYNFPDSWQSIWQLVNSIIPLLAIWVLMYYSLSWSYWITLALAVPASGFMVRVFIIFHDCGHKSFFKKAKWNEWVGFITGLFTFTPYQKWSRSHNKHHETVGNLDKRGTGDILTLTLEEYKDSSKGRKLFYRLYRHPVIMLGIGAPYIFILQNRFFAKQVKPGEKRNVVITNLALAAIITGLSLIIGFKSFVLIQLPILYFSAIAGTWLFYVQHQYSDVHWYRTGNWNYLDVALKGSSFYKLPRILQWFTGNIGFHHIHHLGSKIPNYKLAKCHNASTIFTSIEPISLKSSLKTLKLRLWDEAQNRIVSFKQAGE